ncbi:tRNA (uracil-O(2)-)-methyltransferase [Pseudocercospora fuligena]|uniref:tRNA (uracil-O(2)-)-methyltransferase n=1 Tax=Pseudocercospora fuligena TaxID=685502 RepID=A0A8H6R7G0_9PEZI|nr:tRNA (uracil-O(2)-)-methyltransferase [Pseudocercospora fuligena]
MGSIGNVCEPEERFENADGATKFEPRDRTQIKQTINLPDELWLTILECHCTFPPEIFTSVMQNLIKNPNITSSHLFRADIFYDSDQDHAGKDSLLNQIKSEYQPRQTQWPDFEPTRTIVRKLIPRNFQLDQPLMQTCQNFERREDGKEYTLVVYIPHVEKSSDMPFYHPTVSQLAFLHTWNAGGSGILTLLYRRFPNEQITTKLERTALKLLQTIHKHGQGRLKGYSKRVHLDQIVPQKRYQDTYASLKAKYGRQLSEKWVEVTDPGKHVFEDIGIAGFLIEIWRDMYQLPTNSSCPEPESALPPFPGFVDIGCGNGLLTYLLLMEGYPGYGFDARNRKTWDTFPENIRENLHQKILVPKVLHEAVDAPSNANWTDGIFKRGTFIISNHADELTAWTPLLASLNDSSFIAIPCCSHDLAGARFRAPQKTKSAKEAAARLPQQNTSNGDFKSSQAAETGSLARTDAQKKMPSAYSTLCSYVTSLAEDVGFRPEQDTLRIPSTRNACIIGRERVTSPEPIDEKSSKISEIVESELKRSISVVAADWIERAEKLLKKPSSGH